MPENADQNNSEYGHFLRPVCSLVLNFGKSRASSLLAAHILSGCDVTSKACTKAAAIK